MTSITSNKYTKTSYLIDIIEFRNIVNNNINNTEYGHLKHYRFS